MVLNRTKLTPAQVEISFVTSESLFFVPRRSDKDTESLSEGGNSINSPVE